MRAQVIRAYLGLLNESVGVDVLDQRIKVNILRSTIMQHTAVYLGKSHDVDARFFGGGEDAKRRGIELGLQTYPRLYTWTWRRGSVTQEDDAFPKAIFSHSPLTSFIPPRSSSHRAP